MFDMIKEFVTNIKEKVTGEDRFWNEYFDGLSDYNESKICYDYPVTQRDAIKIADENENLKTDFVRNTYTYKNITWLSFNNYHVELKKVNERKYWNVQVKDADISYVINHIDGTEFCDGYVSNENLAKLNCLIDVQTGEYIYSPKKYNRH